MSSADFVKPIEILLVEDNPGDVQLTKEALEDCKMINNLHVAENGEVALQFLFKENEFANAPKPDLILLDLNLPKVDGREVLEAIKKDDTLKKIPVVVLTTSKADEDILKVYSLHANCYITKPMSIDRFFEVVKAIESFWMGIVVLPH
ncbi:response regulator [Prolixibacteraceae bacterium JC049]|nr:response regulator [Prolixibacteraceae bacterium JC049]